MYHDRHINDGVINSLQTSKKYKKELQELWTMKYPYNKIKTKIRLQNR